MTNDEESALSPEETLRLIERQQAATIKQLKGNPLLVYLPWGVAWLLGFTAFFLHYGLNGVSHLPISQGQAMTVLMCGLLVAGSVATYGIFKMQVHARGASSIKGTMYGYAWVLGLLTMGVITARMGPQLPGAESGLLSAAISLLVVALLFMLGGALWLEKPMFFLGLWTAGVNALGVLLGPGWHALLVAVLLGGGFIVASVWLSLRS